MPFNQFSEEESPVLDRWGSLSTY
uniref:Uncharacterized protein n=1 Tax=Anguilla anguilla TaxID=7936 RepID=A0A0E9RPU4_ANGAN